MFTKRYTWIIPVFLAFFIIIVPFLLFGNHVENLVKNFITGSLSSHWLIALILGLFLASDILIPVPSSFVSTIAGYILGFWEGTLVSLAGMTISGLIGYWIGLRLGRDVTKRFVGETELEGLESLRRRFGDWTLVLTRPVPVLAETAVFFAGISRMPVHSFFMIATLSNLGVSAVYAMVGAYSLDTNSFLLAFCGAVALPGIAMILFKKK